MSEDQVDGNLGGDPILTAVALLENALTGDTDQFAVLLPSQTTISSEETSTFIATFIGAFIALATDDLPKARAVLSQLRRERLGEMGAAG